MKSKHLLWYCTMLIMVACPMAVRAQVTNQSGLRVNANEIVLQGVAGGRLNTLADGEHTALRWTSQQIDLNAPGICGINSSGGRYFWVGLMGNRLVATSTGAGLSLGGVWENACDEHRKTAFEPVDSRAVLQRVVQMPVRRWRYTNEATDVRHLGPTAQEFRAAFGLGTDDKSIGTVDADGVALAAIQGLNEMVTEKEARIAVLESETAALKNQLAAQQDTLVRWETRFTALEQAAARARQPVQARLAREASILTAIE